MLSQAPKPEAKDLDALAAAMQESATPVDVDTLVVRLARLMLDRGAGVRGYAPGARYRVGDSVWLGAQVMNVVAVRQQYNPQQGTFEVLDLARPDADEVRRVVAGVADAPAVAPSPEIDEDAVAALVATSGPVLRDALLDDARLQSLISADSASAGSVSATVSPGRPLRSYGLFSERVLATHLDTLRAEEKPLGACVDAHLAELVQLWSRGRDVGCDWGTAETWRLFVAPVLRILGWSTDPQAMAHPQGSPAHGRSHVIVPNPMYSRAGSSGLYATSVRAAPRVLVMPQPWALPLGCSDPAAAGGCPTTELVGRLGVDGVSWGIVTNGRQWRLYAASQSDPDIGCAAAEFYHVDLEGILDMVKPDAALWATQRHDLDVWGALFESAAYVETTGRPALTTTLKRSSAAYARRVTARLREQLLTAVLPELAGGYIAHRREHLGVEMESDATLRDIMRGSLGLIYRLLFVLHAESKCDLPLHHPEYRGISLTTKLRWSFEQVGQTRTLSRSSSISTQYDALLSLFHNLEHGAPRLGLPSYSGGLFSPVDPAMDFIERHRLSDRVVVRTLAALGQVDGEPVDYTALTARNVSGVAEGLLENSLWVVEAAAGQVALVNRAGTPQVASSSPVPEYVGLSVLERALEQVLATRAQAFAAAMDRATAVRRALGPAPIVSADADVQASLAAAEQAARDALLDIKVVDPSVGAGFFLVAALDVIVDGVMRIVASYHSSHPWVPWSWDPVCQAIQDARTALIDAAAAQGLTADPTRLDDGALLSMLIAGRGLYGVDVNAAAVAAAQASVSIRAFVVGAPFVGTDMHIRRGDSLAGLRLAEVAARDPALAAIVSALPAVVSGAAATNGATRAVLDRVAPYETLLDVLLSEQYGNLGAYDLVCSLGRDLLDGLRGGAAISEEHAAVVAEAVRLRIECGYLHWETAFPEVFLTAARAALERPGFDVVVGSPPSASELGAEPMAAGALAFAAALSSKPQGPFAALAAELVRVPGGRIAFVITPH